MFTALKNKLKGLYGKVTGTQTIEMALGVNSNISAEMEGAITRWRKLYQDNADWLKEPTADSPEKVVSLGLAKQIAAEKARMACLEMKTEITSSADIKESQDSETGIVYTEPKDDGKESRAKYLNSQYQRLIVDNIRNQLELGIALGGFVVKPYVIKHSNDTYDFAVDFSQADDFIPISFDHNGNLTEAAFVEKVVTGDYIYRRVEHHKYSDGKATVVNKAFRAEKTKLLNSNELGKEVSLTSVPQWSALAEKETITADRPLFAYFKMPIANSIDTKSPLGMSVYGGAAEKLIRDADEQYSRTIWEFEGGEMAIDVDVSYVKHSKDDNGNIVRDAMPRKQERLYRLHDYDENTDGWNIHAPTLRDVSFINGLNEIKREIERACAIAPGTISDPNDVAKTAEEIRSGKPASVSSTIDIQKALENTLDHIVYIMNVYADLYNMYTGGEYEVSFEWGNGIKEDPDKEAARKMSEIDRGLATEVDYLVYQYGLTRKQAIEKVKEIQRYNSWKATANADDEGNMQ